MNDVHILAPSGTRTSSATQSAAIGRYVLPLLNRRCHLNVMPTRARVRMVMASK